MAPTTRAPGRRERADHGTGARRRPPRWRTCTRACSPRCAAAPPRGSPTRCATYDEIGDLSDAGRRKMPAMMRGADGRHLTLTRRQVDQVRRRSSAGPCSRPRRGRPVTIEPRNLTAQLHHRAAGNPPSTLPDVGDLQLLPRPGVRLPQRLAADLRGHRAARGYRRRAVGARDELAALRGPLPRRGRRRADARRGPTGPTAASRRRAARLRRSSSGRTRSPTRCAASAGEPVAVPRSATPALERRTIATRRSQLPRAPAVRPQRATGELLAVIDEDARRARRAHAEPLLAVAERLPRVRVLLLGREPAGLRQRRADARTGRPIGNDWMARNREPKRLHPDDGRIRASSTTTTCSATGRGCCASSSAAAITTDLIAARRAPLSAAAAAPGRQRRPAHLLVPDGSRLYDIDAETYALLRSAAPRRRRGRSPRRAAELGGLGRAGRTSTTRRRRSRRCARCRSPSRRSATSAAPTATRDGGGFGGPATSMDGARPRSRAVDAAVRRRRRRASA